MTARRLLLRTTDSILECVWPEKGYATGDFGRGISSESRTGPGMLAIRSKLVQRPFFAQDFALTGRQPGDRRAGRLHLAVEQIGRERAALRGPLDLDELA